MSSPAVTLTGKIRDISGTAIAGTVTATLGNYGNNAPRIATDSELAPISVSTTANGSGVWSLTLWGADQITPASTTYTISITPANSNVAIWIAEYYIVSGSYNLSNLTPLIVTPPIYIQPLISVVGRSAINWILDGSGSTPATGSWGQIQFPYNATITGWTLTADTSGSAVIDVLKSTYAAFPTTASIAGSDKPTLSSAQKNTDSTLTGWGNTALLEGDLVQINLNSVTTCTRLNLTITFSSPA